MAVGLSHKSGKARSLLLLGRYFFDYLIGGPVAYDGGVAGLAGDVGFGAVNGTVHGVAGIVNSVFGSGSSIFGLFLRARSGGESTEGSYNKQGLEGEFHGDGK